MQTEKVLIECYRRCCVPDDHKRKHIPALEFLGQQFNIQLIFIKLSVSR